MIPKGWTGGTVDAIATRTDDNRRIVIKAVNYKGVSNVLLVRLQGSAISSNATIKTFTLNAALDDAPSMKHPDAIRPYEGTAAFTKDLSFTMKPFSVLVVEIIPN